LSNPGFLFTVLAFLLCIGPLVFVHELGHYFVGRWFGVKADAFSIGFGREIFGWTDKRGTRWKVGWLPLGGYVRFAGDMNPASTPSDEWLSLPAEERAKTFQSKGVWQRFLIVLAGPATNFLFAFLAFIAIFAVNGYPSSPPVLGGIVAGSPADRAGLRPGDRILAIDGHTLDTYADLQSYVVIRPGQTLRFQVARDARTFDVPVAIRAEMERDEFGNSARIGRIGVLGAVVFAKVPAAQLPGTSLKAIANTLGSMVTVLGQVVVGERSVRELGGPLKIAEVSGQQASLGWLNFFGLMTVVSINLGFINLLPIPLLDGGHLLFYVIEGVRRRPLKPEAQEWAFRAGLTVLLVLMIFVTLNDLASFGLFTKLGGLIG